jgi:hypothetical protein
MIFRSVRNPTVHRHRAPWTESKPVLAAAHRHGPPPNAMDRHAEVVELWWAQSECQITFGGSHTLSHSPTQLSARRRVNVLRAIPRDETSLENRSVA